jgi:hypothetical protein
VRRFLPELWRQKNWLLHHENASFHRELTAKINMTVIPIHTNSVFPRFKIKLKVRHFDTIEVIVAESLAVLNSLTEHGFYN